MTPFQDRTEAEGRFSVPCGIVLNGYENLNGKLRDGLLNREISATLAKRGRPQADRCAEGQFGARGGPS